MGRGETLDTILTRALRQMMGQFTAVGLFSLVINVLALTTVLYMMQLYDRVLATRSMDTLLYLSVIVGVALLLQGVLEGARGLVLGRASGWVERMVAPEAYVRGLEVRLRGYRAGMESLRDLATCRDFFGSPAMLSIYDLPWVPVYLVFAFLLHPLIGWVSLAGAFALFAVTVLNSQLTGGYLQRAAVDAMGLQRRTEAISRNAEAIDSMGMVPALLHRWWAQTELWTANRQRAADLASILLAISKFLRVALQATCLGVGAWLVLQNELTGGAMMAGSIIMGRALAPVEQMIGAWKQLVMARQSYRRLQMHLSQPRLRPPGVALPEPEGRLSAEQLRYSFPNRRAATIKNVTFRLDPGDSLVMLGPSAAGKTTLIRLLIGAIEPEGGAVRLDGANVFAWPREDLGRHVGYLPQDVELFEGTVLDNIARFENADAAEVIAAAQLAGCHEMILRLPNGYETEIGESGGLLSGGQKQLVGLARALFRNPRLVVLDEPNANMDGEGELALMRALRQLEARKATVILVTHQIRLVQSADKVLILRDGTVEIFGPRDEVMKQPIRPARTAAPVTGVSLVPRPVNPADQARP